MNFGRIRSGGHGEGPNVTTSRVSLQNVGVDVPTFSLVTEGTHQTTPAAVDERGHARGPTQEIRQGRSVFLVAVVALSLITVPLAGGRLAHLADVRMRRTPLIFGALGIQVVIVSLVPGGHPALDRGLHLASYALAAAFLLANRHKAGMRIIAFGALCNAVVISANLGVLPASPGALRAAGQLSDSNSFINSARLAHPRLLFLGDIFAIPKSWPLHNVFSVGDICIAIGAAVTIHALSESRLFARRPRAKRLSFASPTNRDEPTWS